MKSYGGYPSDGIIIGDGMAEFAQDLVKRENLTQEMTVCELTAKATANGVLHMRHMDSHGDGKFLIPVGSTNAQIIEMIKDAKD